MEQRSGDLSELQQENARLQSQLALLSDALENMRHGLCMFDADGRIAFCNRRYPEVIGLPADRVKPGVHARELIALALEAGYYPPDRDIDDIEAAFWANLSSDGVPRGQIQRHGRTYLVQPGQAPDGKRVATFEDITARVAAENALREREAQMRSILDAMPDCVKIFDASGRIVYINPQGLKLMQAPDLETVSASGLAGIPSEYIDQCHDVHRRVLAGEKIVWTFEIVGLRGRRCRVEAHAVPFLLPDGTPAHLCISRDISDRIETESALRRSEQRLRLVQEASGLADFQTDASGVAHCSDKFFEQCGLTVPQDKTIVFEDWLKIVHPDDRARMMAEVMRSLESADSFGCEFRIVRQDTGQTRWISSRTLVERDSEGRVLRTVGAHHDITERKEAENALRRSEQRLRLVQEATGLADFESDANGRTYASDRFFEQLGLSPTPDNILTTNWIEHIHPADRERVDQEIQASLARRDESFASEYRILRADNHEVRWLSCQTRMDWNEDGTHLRTTGSHLDITERKQANDTLRRSEERLRLVQEATGLADFEAGPDGVAHFSPNMLKQMGLPDDHPTRLRVEDWIHLVHPDDRDQVRQVVHAVPDADSHHSEFRIIRADDGEIRWIASSLTMERDANGKIVRGIGAHLDITEHRQAQGALRESEERFRLAAEAAGLGVWDYDATRDKREWSGRLREIFGLAEDASATLDQAIARIHPSHRSRFMQHLTQVREGAAERLRDSIRIRREDDKESRWVEINTWRTHQADGRVSRIIMTVRDVTEEKTAEQRIRWSASHDGLTRLANRAYFQEKLDEAVDAARDSGSTAGVLMLDLDHFKQVNDTLGHDVGDALLKMIADRLREVARSSDTIARLGGDEFAIVLPDLNSDTALLQLAQRIQERMREPFVHQGRLLDCRVSSGGAIFPLHGSRSEELLKNADVALYAAKAAGRATTMVFQPRMRDEIQRRMAMVQLARSAIRNDRMVPYYQPKLDLVTGELAGFEALLRWRMPNGRIGLPASLEAAFEDLEVAAAISDRMIERVIVDMRRWLDNGTPFHHVAVNASAAEFRRDDFAERVLEQLRGADIPTHCFQLEVTETVFLGRGAEYVHRALALLSRHGVKIALDDFGTGYASLRHLKQFPVDIIKIDRSFVRDMEADPGDEAIVRAVINLGKSLGISVVAEGIEAESQAARLFDMGCDFGQGFAFSPAVDTDRVPTLIRGLAESARGRGNKADDHPMRAAANGG